MKKTEKVIERANAIQQMIDGISYNAYGLKWDDENERFVIRDEHSEDEKEVWAYRCELFNAGVAALLKML